MMSSIKLGFLAIASLVVVAAVSAREVIDFNTDWRFVLGDQSGAELAAFDDSDWRKLDVPHDWSIELAFDPNLQGGSSVGYLPGGIGWYRKTFTVPESARDLKTVIDFDGVYMDSQVWINGHLLGRRPNGYIGLHYDLTPYLNYGDKNVIAVRANVEPSGSRWYPGAGIYRRVWLSMLSPVHVAQWGTYVRTPEVTQQAATVLLDVEVVNESSTERSVLVQSHIVNAAGETVAEAESRETVAANQTPAFTQQFTVQNPKLWSPDTPNLYEVKTSIIIAGKLVDEVTTPLGIRTCEFTKDEGFFLNGEHVDIKGVCLHHDFGPIGTAFHPRALEWQLEILREMGCNAIRTAHNPRDPEFYAICDRMGFMVMNEAFDVWMQKKLPNDFHQFFEEWHERDLTDMVRRDRNHPSIIIWSVGNEMNEQHHEDYPGQGGVITRRLVAICKQHDPSRVVTAACNVPAKSKEVGITDALDVYGQNYGLGFYANEIGADKPVIGTENATSFATRGSYAYDVVLDRGIKLRIQNTKNNSECTGYGKFWEDVRTEGTLLFVRDTPRMAGQFAWTGFDYIGESFPFPWPGRNGLFGIIDMVGFPKDTYYVYQADWTDKPMVHMIPQNWNWPQFKGKGIPVWVYSNHDEVELFLNGRSLGVKQINRDESLHAEWEVPYQPGELKAVARKDGQVVATQILRTANEVDRLELSADRSAIAADGADLSFIEVKLADANGTLCPDSDRMVQVKVEGEGVLYGVGNGSAFNHASFKGTQVSTFYGLCRVIVKSTRKHGSIQVTVSADGVEDAQVEIKTLAPQDARLALAKAEKVAHVLEANQVYSRHRITAHGYADADQTVSGFKASASSEQAGHPPEHAIDGDPETRWSPKDGKPGHVWQVDLGTAYDLTGIKILWQVPSLYQYRVEGAVDGTRWVLLNDQSKRTEPGDLHTLNFQQAGIRYVRVVTTGLPKGLWGTFYEVEILGEPSASSAVDSSGARVLCRVAPVFKHGSGKHVDSVIVSRNPKPPTWSKQAARTIIQDEARRHGLEFIVTGEIPMELGGVSTDGTIAFEVLTSEGVAVRTDNTDHITDFYGAAQKRVAELRQQPGNFVIGVFYDPLAGKDGKPDEAPLRQQVRDFIDWMK